MARLSMTWTTTSLLALTSLLTSTAVAQTIEATNTTSNPNYGQDIEIGLSHGSDSTVTFPVVPLTQGAGVNIPSTGLSGVVTLADDTNSLSIRSSEVALISCDPYGGEITPSSVFSQAVYANATAIVFYSESSESCYAPDTGSYQWVYASKSRNQSVEMLQTFNRLVNGDFSPLYAVLAHRSDVASAVARASSNNGNSSATGQQNNPLGPSPSTAVAMIILYSITGVITALFLVIIITGAVRAHRHPERYGPRNGLGRPRQTRARGIARAMLDSIPIVKVKDRDDQPPKPTEIELEDGHGQGEQTSEPSRAVEASPQRSADAQSGDGNNESGIAAAEDNDHQTSTQEDQGCSICTEDFEPGQDQRVLPCDHRFHPACIDPWLLNISGTCPLCRIDLRPEESAELDEHGDPIVPEGELAPPLEGDNRRTSIRRSIMLGIMGIHRPERMTREESINALRHYREQQRTAQIQQDEATNAHLAEPSTRSRLRNAFRIRTRRTGERDSTSMPAVPETAHTASEPPESQDEAVNAEGNETTTLNTSSNHARI